ncbi:MAG: GNAT family N-acetyltransferase [Pseudomonadota bacterium]
MTPTIREVGREAREALLPLMEGLQAVERAMEANRVPPSGIGPHLDRQLDLMERDGGFALLAEAEGRPVGFLIGLVVEDADLYVLPENRRLGAVTDLYVAEAARRQGLAARLMAEAEARFVALGLPRMSIGALAGNAAARALYLRWAGREHAVIYEKPIGAETTGL